MGWAARAKVRSGNQTVEVSSAGRVVGGSPSQSIRCSDGTRYVVSASGSVRRVPAKVRGKATVKAAKRARTFGSDGQRVIRIAA